jgi:hypothetical protein
MATWTRVGKSEVSGVTVYVDYNTIQKSGNKVKVWTLKDFKTVQEANGVKYSSFKIQEEFNCDGGLNRSLMHHAFSGSMGNGEIVNSYDNIDEWRPVKPRSIGELQSKAVCGNK